MRRFALDPGQGGQLIPYQFRLPETLDAVLTTVCDYFNCDRMSWEGLRYGRILSNFELEDIGRTLAIELCVGQAAVPMGRRRNDVYEADHFAN